MKAEIPIGLLGDIIIIMDFLLMEVLTVLMDILVDHGVLILTLTLLLSHTNSNLTNRPMIIMDTLVVVVADVAEEEEDGENPWTERNKKMAIILAERSGSFPKRRGSNSKRVRKI